MITIGLGRWIYRKIDKPYLEWICVRTHSGVEPKKKDWRNSATNTLESFQQQNNINIKKITEEEVVWELL